MSMAAFYLKPCHSREPVGDEPGKEPLLSQFDFGVFQYLDM